MVKISELTQDTTPAIGDSIPTYDTSAAGTKRTTFEDAYKTINGLTADTAPASGDFIVTYDITASAAKKTTLGDVLDDVGIVADTTPQLGGALDLNDKSITQSFTAGEDLADGDLCYLKSDGKMWKADADSASTSTTLLAMCTATIVTDASGVFLIWGKYTTSGLTMGSNYFISTTAGDITTTAPSGSGDIVRIAGTALSTTVLFFNPSVAWVEIP